MMHREAKCEDVIDLSSDDEDLLSLNISNKETSNIAVQLDLSCRPEQFTQYSESIDQCFLDTQRPSTLTHAEFNTCQSTVCGASEDREHVFVQHLPASAPPQCYEQSDYRCAASPPIIQQKLDSKNFWKAGDYDRHVITTPASGIDHVRVHPKFLHSNATSHKWALGAIAELLDNAIDEVQSGATYVRVDSVENPADGSPMLLVQDDGGGMEPDCMRRCMSLGYSEKTAKTTIGQYGNGFKTSTMRLGADVIVFSRSSKNGSVTESVGLLSYTFLRETGKEDIIVPMVDFELPLNSETHRALLRTTTDDWLQNLQMILQWSPYKTEMDLLTQFTDFGLHGTKIIVYNLWLNDDGDLELDFTTDTKDIQLRGGSKKGKHESLLKKFTSEHISHRLRYSLRAYSSILYLHMPQNFQVILRGHPVEHFSIAGDLKFPEHILYRPQIANTAGEVSVVTTIGFAKEAPMVNVHGFNVYHKNRLIMPFWKVFHENSSRGKGVVGVLEANFMEPAHDKQDFERTPILQRLEARLKAMTVEYWNLHCDLIGYQRTRQAVKAPTNVLSIANVNPVYTSVNNHSGAHTPQGVIETGIPAHLYTAAANFSTHLNSYPDQKFLEFKASLGTSPPAISLFSPRLKDAQGTGQYDAGSVSNLNSTHRNGSRVDISLRNAFKNQGMSAPSTPSQPASDAELLAKHADTTSDGCSNLASPFQSDCSESSLHAIARSITNQHSIVQEEIAGKRLASEANLEVLDTDCKQHVTLSLQRNVGTERSAPSSHSTVASLEEVEQLRLRCKQYLWEKQHLELKVLKLQQELLHAHNKLKAYEAQ